MMDGSTLEYSREGNASNSRDYDSTIRMILEPTNKKTRKAKMILHPAGYLDSIFHALVESFVVLPISFLSFLLFCVFFSPCNELMKSNGIVVCVCRWCKWVRC